MRGVVFNGKFYAQSTTGVQRVARRLIAATSTLAGQESHAPHLSIALPGNASDVELPPGLARTPPARRSGNIWEQAELPRAAGRDLLVNLCNIGPLTRRGDIVMIHDAQAFLSPASYSAAFGAWYRAALPILARRASRVLTVSDYARDCLVQFNVAPADKISVIPNGVDHIVDAPADSGAVRRLDLGNRPFVVAPASVQAHKNIKVVVEAARRLSSSDARIVLFGKDTRETFIHSGFALDDRILFAGRVSDGEMRGLIEASCGFVFPSTTEGFGLPPLEAMWLGAPAIVSTGGALPEVCGDATLYADPADPDAWAAAIDAVVSDAALRADLSQRARAQAAQYTWCRAAGALLEHIFAAVRS